MMALNLPFRGTASVASAVFGDGMVAFDLGVRTDNRFRSDRKPAVEFVPVVAKPPRLNPRRKPSGLALLERRLAGEADNKPWRKP